uniref:Phospholipid-transporting ATPase n=1 Tax=Elaeophora elaphi TaxID=1147741 RepID=A0A0R3RW30_9BILA
MSFFGFRIRQHSSRVSASRIIYVNQTSQPEKYRSNAISTAKYNAFSFFPRFLKEQFRRYSNVFFLIIAILQQIPDVSPTGRFTTAGPFIIILVVSAIKEIFEDIKRRKSDQTVNNYCALVLRDREWKDTLWKNLKVGDIVRVENNQMFPADMALLSSSEPLAIAYIETSNLDGETNLKIRQGLECTSDLIATAAIRDFQCEIECEHPNQNVNEFTGTLHMHDLQRPLSIPQLLLRGARLKHTQWICGVVLYAGHDAKLLMNSKVAPLKQSKIDAVTNQRILFLFFALVALSFISAVGAYFFDHKQLINAYYLGFQAKGSFDFFWNMLTFFILYNNLIPISLQVTLELVRFFQAVYINNDIAMYDEKTDSCAVARTSNLNEELGQVKFIMSDKTGTLTRNIMKFKRCSVAGINFGNDETDDFQDFNLPELIKTSDEKANSIKEFLRMMAICHTVVPERDKNDELQYQASSPDESALVRAAATLGFVFHTRKPQSILVSELGEIKSYNVLNVLEFTSDRKRMGVVVQCPDGVLKLYVKGADSMIFERLRKDLPVVDNCAIHLEDYASKGYRTLCFAMRVLELEEYNTWAQEFEKASISIDKRAEKLAECAEKIERNLTLVGASAIEDKLQQYVPETITALLAAQIRVWMLTGDKRETAINIAHSAGLVHSDMNCWFIDGSSCDEVFKKLCDCNNSIQPSTVQYSLIIDGSTLKYIAEPKCRKIFGNLAVVCSTVVCCRMTPMQKAEVVEMVREATHDVILAVGDGANDVAMIQAANVGVGIIGEEGLQAASASDYSIAQFHFLRRLLLVHGAWNYERGVKVILYSFYKNICLYLIELWFAIYSAFSGQTIFERWTIALFNVAFTALPPVMIGLFDRPLSDQMMLSYPSLYESFQKRAFTINQFAVWIGLAVLHSLLLFFLSFAFLYDPVVWNNGRVGGWLMLGNSCYTFVVATVCLKALLECDSWTIVILFSCFGSILLWFIFLPLYSLVWPVLPIGEHMSGMASIMLSSSSFWLALICIPTITLFTDFIIKTIRMTFAPTPREVACFHEHFRTQSRDIYCELHCLRRNEQLERPESNGTISETICDSISESPALEIVGEHWSDQGVEAESTGIQQGSNQLHPLRGPI